MSKTILYIEDNDDNVQLVKALSESAGYSILIAYDGKEGLKIAQEEIPDLVIVDYHLPYMNGADVARALRENDITKHIPIIMLTADLYSYPEAVEIGIEDYLNKPIRRNMFISRVERIFNPESDA